LFPQFATMVEVNSRVTRLTGGIRKLMDDRLSGIEFARYLWHNKLVIALACGTALVITAVVSALLPARYTAMASLLIEPPAGNDPRAATAVSPVYLESLKTYEHLVSSDSLFLRALDDLHLRERYSGTTIEALKQRVLRVSKPANTKIIEISATLGDPRLAQALAQYIAEDAAELNASLDRSSMEDLSHESKRIYTAATTRLEKAQHARDEFSKTMSVETLEKEVGNAAVLRSEVGKDLARARAGLADYEGQQSAPMTATGSEGQPRWTEMEIAATRSRIQDLESQDRKLRQFLSENGPILEKLRQRQESLDAELKSARTDMEAAQTKLNDIQASAGLRGERLTVLDPGIVPQRQSFPNTPLNLVVACLVSLRMSVAYLAARFAYVRATRTDREPVYSLR
jgi:uncharacterized protein involved in exopolysaccharide biosynthesis